MNSSGFVVTRAPFRVSFAGGGTDLAEFYEREYGLVCSTTIDKYVYVIINRQRPIVHGGIDRPGRHRIRLSYAHTEYVDSPDELNHPIVREAIKFLDVDIPMDIATMADIPSGTGLGSSGTFTVALLHALHIIKGNAPTPEQLASEAAHIEMTLLERPVGKQDHYAAAFGGLNSIKFMPDGQVDVQPILMATKMAKQFFPFLMLIYTGQSRDSGTVLNEQQKNVGIKMGQLLEIRHHAIEIDRLFNHKFDSQTFGKILDQTWSRKRELATTVTNSQINALYDRAIKSGALGGKICGAGGGGFLLLVVDPYRRQEVLDALSEFDELKIGYEPNGSQLMIG